MQTWRLRCQYIPITQPPINAPQPQELQDLTSEEVNRIMYSDDHSITESPFDARGLWSNIQPHYLVIEDPDQDSSSPEPHHHSTIIASHSTTTFSTSSSTLTSTISTLPPPSSSPSPHTTTLHHQAPTPPYQSHTNIHHHYRRGISRVSCSKLIQIEPLSQHQHPPTPS